MAGANQTVLPPISWSQDFYSLSFQQNTLPPGTGWWANVTGQPGQFSTGLTATYSSLPYATYTYAIASDNKVWNPSPSGGSVLLDTNKAIPITFTPVSYLVKFNEIGLPSGTEWWANVSGQSPLSTTGTSISTSLINGSYTYTISTTNKSYSAPGGPFTVAGGPVNNQVLFTQQAYTVAFVESGLKKGLFWNVTFLGLMQSSKSTIITFNSVPNGSYPFVIGALPGWIATPPNGTVVVRGAATDQTVVWSQLVYNVTVNVTGLAPPGRWWVNLTGPTGNSSHPTTGSSNVIALPNGTYAFTIASQDKSWEPNITKGSFLVNGAALEFSVTFVELVQPVTFTETGLPSGTEWWANLTGGHTNLSLGSTIGFQLPNGTYGYRVQAVDRTWAAVGGNVTVNGAPASVSVNFTNVLFLVQFNETGLPAGTTWSIILAGATNSTFAPGNNTFHEPNGTLPYTVGPVAGYQAKPGSGNITVRGHTAAQTIAFRAVSFPIGFNETGLPKGTGWWVNITNVGFFEFTFHNGTIPIANGSYTYVVGSNNSSWTPTVRSGGFAVDGALFTLMVIFLESAYSVTFLASGLPNGAIWSAVLHGATTTSTTSSLTFAVANGTYSFTIPRYGIYFPTPASGNVTVKGANVTVPLTFVFARFTATFAETGLPNGANWSITLDGVTQYSTASTMVFPVTNGTFPFVVASAGHPTPSPASGWVRIQGADAQTVVTFPTSSGGMLSTLQIGVLVGLLVAGMIVVLALFLSRRSRRPPEARKSRASVPSSPSPPMGAIYPYQFVSESPTSPAPAHDGKPPGPVA